MSYSPDYYLNDVELYLFNEGKNAYAYRTLGCHRVTQDDKTAMRFAVWAPHAQSVSVVGNFNHWTVGENALYKRADTGVWETHISNLPYGELYKYAIKTQTDEVLMKADPYAFFSELQPGHASIAWDLAGYEWRDQRWLKKRAKLNSYSAPVSIYEMHLGSWHGAKNYREIAQELIPYVKKLGFTHVALMPLAEYTRDDTWGYQTTSFFSATARYGEPKDLMFLIDALHTSNIGVILDWTPAYFSGDEHGLCNFDGVACYENEKALVGAVAAQQDILPFDYSQGEVASFLMSSAAFWLDYFHIDGLRGEAVSRMLYREDDEAEFDDEQELRHENNCAIEFLRRTSEKIQQEFPGVMFSAQEMTDWPMLTKMPNAGGLGFNYAYNTRWIHKMLDYIMLEPVDRKERYNELILSMFDAFNEQYILPVSHDCMMKGKQSMLDKMPGDYWRKFANLRLFLAYMFAHPGKKLMFMGTEIAQFIEWRYYEPIEWHLLEYPSHQGIQNYVKRLNYLYQKTGALYEQDDSWAGFEWLNTQDAEHSVIAFARYGKKTGQTALICIFNFTPVTWNSYSIGVPFEGYYKEVLNSDNEHFGGSGIANLKTIKSQLVNCNGQYQSINCTLPPLGAVYLEWSDLNEAEWIEQEIDNQKQQCAQLKREMQASNEQAQRMTEESLKLEQESNLLCYQETDQETKKQERLTSLATSARDASQTLQKQAQDTEKVLLKLELAIEKKKRALKKLQKKTT